MESKCCYSTKPRKWGGSMNAIISKEPMGASFGGEWVKLGEREISSSQSYYESFCDFSNVYEAISVIHVTYMSGNSYSGLVCTYDSNDVYNVSAETWPYYYIFTKFGISEYNNWYLTKHFWKNQFYNDTVDTQKNVAFWSPEPNTGYITSSSNIWISIRPDTIYQMNSSNPLVIDGTQTIYGLKIS